MGEPPGRNMCTQKLNHMDKICHELDVKESKSGAEMKLDLGIINQMSS